MDNKKKYGQYFTTDAKLRSKVISFIHNLEGTVLEPSVGQGDLVQELLLRFPDRKVDMYEIDQKIKLLSDVPKQSVKYVNFLTTDIKYKYKCIIGNPPYVKTPTGNLYIKFINKCFELLDNKSELIFVVPSDVFKLTSMSKLWKKMLAVGNITHVYHPNVENLFTDASIDVVIFRYEKSSIVNNECKYNSEIKYVQNDNGLITFTDSNINDTIIFGDKFDVYVGMVSGKESVYRNPIGNIELLVKHNKKQRYILCDSFPSNDEKINKYLLEHKTVLMSRKIKKFGEHNWYQWGAPRNIKVMKKYEGKDCIYIYNLTRADKVAHRGIVQMFGGNLLMLYPKNNNINLYSVVDYLNSSEFKNKFTQSGRFKIGQRHLKQLRVSKQCFNSHV